MNGLPEAVVRRLDGTGLGAVEGESFCLAVEGVDGWPHVALLSAGELLALSPMRLRLALHAGSGTTAGLEANSRGVLLIAHDGGALVTRLSTRPARRMEIEGTRLACFDGDVEEVTSHHAGYAELLSGPRFRLTGSEPTVERWRATIAALREAA